MTDNLVVGEQDFSAPDIVGKVTALRVFDYDDGCLVSPNQNVRWDKSVMEAGCGRYHSPLMTLLPSENCTCGLYGFKDIEYIDNNWFYNAHVVLAVTEHWGKTVVHKDGLRSQYSQIKAITVNDTQKLKGIFYNLGIVTLCLIFLSILLLFGSTATTLGIITAGLAILCMMNYIGLKWYLRFLKRHNIKTLKSYAKQHNIIFCKDVKQLLKHHDKRLP